MLAVTIGGWSQPQRLTPANSAWCVGYVLIAAHVWRWARGLLSIAAGLEWNVEYEVPDDRLAAGGGHGASRECVPGV